MKKEQKEAILQYVKGVDPAGEVVRLDPSPDFEGGTINWGPRITQHRVETQLKKEKWAEAYLVAKLVRELDYPDSSVELQKEYPAGHPLTTKPRMDVVVRDDRQADSKTFMVIEAKAPGEYEEEKTGIEGQLFGLGDHERPKGLRYMVYYTVEYLDGKLADKAIIIDAHKFPDFKTWDQEGRPSLDRLPHAYATAIKSVYVNKRDEDLGPDEKTLSKWLSRNDFRTLRRDLHNVIWGGGGTPDNDVFSNLVKLFLAKIYDEEFTPGRAAYTFQIIYKDGEPQPASEIVIKLNSKRKLPSGEYEGILRRAQKHYLEMSDPEIEASTGLDTEKVSPGKVAYVVEQLQGVSLTENENKDNTDILGEFFESIVRAGFKQSKGQFFTHPHLVKFCIYALKLDDLVEEKIRTENTLPHIIDPACGSGTYLIEAMKAVTHTVRSRDLARRVHMRARQLIASWFPPLKENIWAKEFVYGTEINSDLALATKVNMVLHGDGNINVFIKDGLLDFDRYMLGTKVSVLAVKSKKSGFPYAYSVNEQFDILLSNPPFSVDLDSETKRGLAARFEFARKRNSENLFVERWYQLLKSGGRMAVVLPEAAFDTGENLYIRLFLFRYFHVKAIVSLPELAFKPWTPTRTSLLFAVKKTDEEVRAYDKKWREKEKEFRKLRESPLVSFVLRGQKLIGQVRRLCSIYGIAIRFESSPLETVRSLSAVLKEVQKAPEFDPKHLPRVERYFEEVESWSKTDQDVKWSSEESRRMIKRYSKAHFDPAYEGRTISEILERHWEEIVRIAGSPWWIFTEVAEHFYEDIAYFEVENIGYKRTLNKERSAPNDLFSISTKDGQIDLTDTTTVLGKIRAEVKY